jgi:hypothetical protein
MGLLETNPISSNLLLENFWRVEMNKRIVATFDPQKLADNRYTLIFDNLRSAGIDVDILPDVDPSNLEGMLSTYRERITDADMVFHIPAFTSSQLYWAYETDFRAWTEEMSAKGHSWTSDEYDALQKERKENEGRFQRSLNELVGEQQKSGTILDADVFLESEGEVYTTLDQMDIPRINRMTVEDWEAKKPFPAVFKMKNTSQGQGIYHIETDDQFRKLFDKDYIQRDDQYGSGRFSDSRDYFDVSEFVECPSDHFTHYRVFTLGDGTIMGAVLSYSGLRKSDDERIAVDDVNIHDVYDDVKSPLFLNRKKVVSNKGNGGNQIPLYPTDEARPATEYELEILAQHGVTDQQIPQALEDQARRTAQRLGDKGLYVLGQDWIQGKDGKFYCLEVNAGPQFGIFDTLYNQGRGDDDAAQRIATEKISQGILSNLQRNRV